MTRAMEPIGRLLTRHAKLVVIGVVLITVGAGLVLAFKGVESEFSEESFLPDTELAKANQEVGDRFRSTFSLQAVVHAENGNVLTADVLTDMLAVQVALAEDPEISVWFENPDTPAANFGSVANFVAQTVLAGMNITLPSLQVQHQALQGMTDADVQQAIVEFLNSSLTPEPLKTAFTLFLTSDFDPGSTAPTADGTILSVAMRPALGDDPEAALEVERRADRIIRDENLAAARIVLLGSQMISAEINRANNESLGLLLPITFLAVFIILGLVYRSAFDLAISVLALGFALLWMYAFASLAGFLLNPLTLVVPILIVGLGIDYGIHIVMRYREEARNGSTPRDATVRSVATVGSALLLTTITTAVAFLTNVVSPLSILVQFGILAAVGILATFVTMTTFVPAAKYLREARREAKGVAKPKGNPRRKRRRTLDRVLGAGAVAAERHPGVVLAVVAAITIGALFVGLQVDREFEFSDFLPETLEITKEIEYVTDNFGVGGPGESSQTSILIKGDVADPALLSGLADTVDRMADDEWVLQSGGQPDVEHVLALMADYATFDTTPGVFDTRFNLTFAMMYAPLFDPVTGRPTANATAANVGELYDWLFANALRDVGSFVARDAAGVPDATLLLVATTAVEDPELDALKAELAEDIGPVSAAADSAIVTGGLLLFKDVTDTLEETQINSLILAIAAALVLLIIVFRAAHASGLVGALTAIPVLLVVAWAIGTMYLVGISFNVVTIVITSLVIGLGIDYAIHISHRFMEDRQRYERLDEVTQSTLAHTGLALFGAAGTTIVGFGLLLFALLPPIQQFGAVTAMTILYSLLGAVFVLPAMLVAWARRKRKKESGK